MDYATSQRQNVNQGDFSAYPNKDMERYYHLKMKHKDFNEKMDYDNQGDFSANPNKDMKDNLGLKPRQY